MRRLNSHGIISTKASAQTTATVDDEGRGEPVVLEPAVEHDLERAEKGRDQHEADDIEPVALLLSRLRSASAAADSRRISAISAIAIAPTGPLIRKHQCQEKLSASQPPSVGPTTGATTTATPNSAKAWPRFAGGNASARIDCATGTMPPPPRPCRMRNSSSAFRFGAKPHSTELSVNSAETDQEECLAAEPFGPESWWPSG